MVVIVSVVVSYILSVPVFVIVSVMVSFCGVIHSISTYGSNSVSTCGRDCVPQYHGCQCTTDPVQSQTTNNVSIDTNPPCAENA